MLNNTVFIGRVSTELKLRKTKSNVSCCSFNMAVQRKNTDITDFPPMVAYGKLADIICSYVQKGDLIGVEAVYQSYVKNKKKYHEFKIEEIQFLEKRKRNDYNDIEIPSATAYSDFPDSGDGDDLPF